MDSPPQSQAAFDAVMFEIDADLRAQQVAIPARFFQAVGDYARRFGLEIPIPPSSYKATPGVYVGKDAAAHIGAWMNARYGDRQKVHFGPGSTILLVRQDAWELRLPYIAGTVQCVADPDLERYANEPNIGMRRPPVINVLSLIEDFPQGLARELSEKERGEILYVFRLTFDRMQAIDNMRDNPLVPEAISDLGASVQHVFSAPPHYGLSKWASAQAAEKLLKSFLTIRGIKYPFSHKIGELARLAQGAGMPPLDASVQKALDTPASARYGDIGVSLGDACNAHYGAQLVGKLVALAVAGAP